MAPLRLPRDKESSIVHGMPGEAIKLDAATYVYPPEKIASVLAGLVRNEKELLTLIKILAAKDFKYVQSV
ncbi:MAG: hypothetical protein U0586_03740 [Candidatus Brocadiaceae bacterium]